MATSNNDRVSSQRLLDTLKGLQASRHLGSEPVVETETVEYPAVVCPAVGTYTADEISNGVTAPVDDRLPFKVYHTQYDFTYPVTISEPAGEYSEITKSVTVNGNKLYVEEQFDEMNTYNGYVLVNVGFGYVGMLVTNGLEDSNHYHVWEMPAYTETTTTKTKRPIKQDYVPNADWTQNDPDGDGYVQGRTHWVEVGESEGTVSVQSGAQMGNFAIGTCDEFGAVKSFTYPNGEYNPGRIGEIFEAEGIQFSYIGEDANGDAIIPTNIYELENALSTTAIGIMLLVQGASIMVYVAYPNVAANDVCTVTLVSEVVHKLNKKFYEWIDGEKIQTKIDYSNSVYDYNGKYSGKYGFNRTTSYKETADVALDRVGVFDVYNLSDDTPTGETALVLERLNYSRLLTNKNARNRTNNYKTLMLLYNSILVRAINNDARQLTDLQNTLLNISQLSISYDYSNDHNEYMHNIAAFAGADNMGLYNPDFESQTISIDINGSKEQFTPITEYNGITLYVSTTKIALTGIERETQYYTGWGIVATSNIPSKIRPIYDYAGFKEIHYPIYPSSNKPVVLCYNQYSDKLKIHLYGCNALPFNVTIDTSYIDVTPLRALENFLHTPFIGQAYIDGNLINVIVLFEYNNGNYSMRAFSADNNEKTFTGRTITCYADIV